MPAAVELSVLSAMLRSCGSAVPAAPASKQSWWSAFEGLARGLSDGQASTLDVAMLSGHQQADGLGYAFLAGYQCALHHLVCRELSVHRRSAAPPPPWLPRALCATEKQKGARPDSIATTLSSAGDGLLLLTGHKSFVTCPDLARELLVFARSPATGRLHLVSLPADARLQLGNELVLPFVPEITHSSVTFDALPVPPHSVWSQPDAWSAYVRPFRLIEDLHVAAAAVGHYIRLVSSVARQHPLVLDLLACAAAVLGCPLAVPALDAPALELTAAAISHRLAELTAKVADFLAAELPSDARLRTNFERDVKILSVAATARHLRTEKAWSKL